MFSKVMSGAVLGIDSYLSSVEVDAAAGMPEFSMVGLLGSEVREARERVRVALKNTGIAYGPMKITVNISPADIRKEGAAYDLPIAVGILASLSLIPVENLRDTLILGELGLDGEVKFVKGVLPIVMEAAKRGIKRCIVPVPNGREAAVVQEVDIIGVSSLMEAYTYLKMPERDRPDFIPPMKLELSLLFRKTEESQLDFSEVSGQTVVKRAAEIAAAGFHHFLMVGPPGSGKTMIAQRMPSILPSLTLEESIEVSTIYSVAGLLSGGESLITKRPFLSPHHTSSEYAMAGGGKIPKPGVISLAHRGILMLDELPEFKREAIEILRQPMEDKQIHISRSYGTFTYPADFMLVAAMNPCPCGYFPDRNKCRCKPHEIHKYLHRISGPVLDRIDLCIQVPPMDIQDITANKRNESSSQIRKRIMGARKIQQNRFSGTKHRFNADLSAKDIMLFCPLRSKERIFMEQAYKAMGLSVRAYHRVLKTARTIADLDGWEQIKIEHLKEALCYRIADMERVLEG